MSDDKKRKFDQLRQMMLDQKQKEFLEGRKNLQLEGVPRSNKPSPFLNKPKMKPEHDVIPVRDADSWKEKIDRLTGKGGNIKEDPDTLDYRKLKKEFVDKKRLSSGAKDILGEGAEEVLDYNKLRSSASKLGKLSKLGKKGLKLIPLLGPMVGLGMSAMSGEVSAQDIPILGEASDLGPEEGSLEHKLESGTITPEERFKLLRKFQQEEE